MDGCLGNENISLVAVSRVQPFEFTSEDSRMSQSRLQYEEKKSKRTKCLLMAAFRGNEDELKRLGKAEEGAIDEKDELGSSAMHYAVRHNNTRVIKMLLNEGADVNLKGPRGQTPLYIAARFNCIDVAKELISNNADPTIQSDDNSVPLHAASRHDYQDMVILLLNSDASVVNWKSSGSVTPLALACRNPNKSTCELLTRHKADITAVDVENKTPLHIAAAIGNIEVVKFLIDTASKRLKNMSDFLNKRDYEGKTPLILSSHAGHEDVVKELLQNGSDPLIQTRSFKETALHVAAVGGNTVVMGHLLSYGTSIEALDSTFRTPLHRAAKVNQISTLKFLLNKGAKVDPVDITTMTPFLLAVKNDKKEAVSVLLDGGANIKATDMQFRTCLHFAVKHNAVDVLKILIEKDDGALLEMKDVGLQTPLHYAAACGDVKMISLLLRTDSQLHQRDTDEATPLHIAALTGSVNATDLLCRMSPKTINTRDIHGGTPLHCAVQGGFRKTLKVLLSMNGNPTLRDMKRRTVLHVAVESGYLNCVKTLLDHEQSLILEMLDIDENTALHLACARSEVEIVKVLLDANADLTVRNREGKTCLDVAIDWELEEVSAALVQHKRWWEILRTQGPDGHRPMKRLIEVLPSVAEVALNKCLEVSNLPSTNPDHYIKFNLVLLDPGPDDEPSLRGDPFDAPSTMVKFDRANLLNHPVTQALLRYKWFAYGKVLYYLNFAFYLTFMVLFTYFIIVERQRSSLFSTSNVNDSSAENERLDIHSSNSTMPLAIAITFCLCIQLLRELYQMFMLKFSYFKDFTNLIELLLCTATFVFITPYLAAKPLYYSPSVQWKAGVVALVTCYSDLLLYIRRVGQAGIYVSMYFEVLITLLKVLSVFVVVIFGSSVTFFVLLKEEDNFSSVLLSFVKTTVMMVGELDYTDMLSDYVVNKQINSNTGAPYVPLPDVTYIVFFLFLMLVPVLLMNLLVGLAVGDIDAIQKSAAFSRLKDQARFVEDIQKRYPLPLAKMIYKDKLVIYPNTQKFFKSKTCPDFGKPKSKSQDGHLTVEQSFGLSVPGSAWFKCIQAIVNPCGFNGAEVEKVKFSIPQVSLLMAGTSVIDSNYVENLSKLKSSHTKDDKNDLEDLRWKKQKLKIQALEAKVDQQNKLLVAIGQKLRIDELDSSL